MAGITNVIVLVLIKFTIFIIVCSFEIIKDKITAIVPKTIPKPIANSKKIKKYPTRCFPNSPLDFSFVNSFLIFTTSKLAVINIPVTTIAKSILVLVLASCSPPN